MQVTELSHEKQLVLHQTPALQVVPDDRLQQSTRTRLTSFCSPGHFTDDSFPG